MIYLVDVEISGVIAVRAKNESQALEIAENLEIDQLKDFFLNTNTFISEKIHENDCKDDRIFTYDDI